jgi:hypothetical protein
MPNPIKYTAGTETLALKKGNFYIGTGDVGKGPSDTTGYYQGPNVPSGGYVIYLNKEGAPGGLSYHSAANDAQLIAFTNSIAGQSYTGVNQCFDYYYSQNDKVLVNQDYPPDYPYIVMDGLVLNLDAGITQSYPGSGTTWTDVNGLGPKNNGTLINGPTFSSDGGGSIVFDGVDDFVNCGNPSSVNMGTGDFTLEVVFKATGPTDTNFRVLLQKGNPGIGSQRGYRLRIENNNFVQLTVTADSERTSTTTQQIGYGNYYYVTATKNTSGIRTYLNGVLSGQGISPLGTTTVVNDLIIGRQDGGLWPFRGDLAVTRIYNRSLTAAEVLQNYNAQKGRFGL